MENTETWYIVKRPTGFCDILASTEVNNSENPNIVQQWGPFSDRQQAIARQVGLIRAGKCQPK